MKQSKADSEGGPKSEFLGLSDLRAVSIIVVSCKSALFYIPPILFFRVRCHVGNMAPALNVWSNQILRKTLIGNANL